VRRVRGAAAVALGNFWLLSRAILRLSAEDSGAAPAARRRGHLMAMLQGAALRLVLAGAALGLTLAFLPVHPIGVVVGLVGVHAGMAVVWLVTSAAGSKS
jgi:hypothetical protein